MSILNVSHLSSANHVSVKIGGVTAVLALTAVFLLLLTLKETRSETAHGVKLYNSRAFIISSAKFLLKLAMPLLPYYLSIMVISQADKLFVSSIFGKSELAKYSVAYSAGVALTAITGGIMGALSPWLMRKARANEYKK